MIQALSGFQTLHCFRAILQTPSLCTNCNIDPCSHLFTQGRAFLAVSLGTSVTGWVWKHRHHPACVDGTYHMALIALFGSHYLAIMGFKISEVTEGWFQPTAAWNGRCMMEGHGARNCGCLRNSVSQNHTQKQEKPPCAVHHTHYLLPVSSSSANPCQNCVCSSSQLSLEG